MKKKLLIVACVLLTIVIAAGVILFINKDRLVRAGIEKGMSFVLLTDVTLEKAKISFKEGSIDLYNFKIANPEGGFKTPEAFSFGHSKVAIDFKSFNSDEPHIKVISINEPHITLEQDFKKSNFKQLIKNASRFDTGETKEETEQTQQANKKVVIDLVKVENAKVTVASSMMPANVNFTLPVIEMEDIGKNEEGATVAESIQVFLVEVMNSTLDAGKGIIPDDVSDAIASGLEEINDQLGKIVSIAGEGAGTAVEGAKSATEGVTKGIKGLLKKDNN